VAKITNVITKSTEIYLSVSLRQDIVRYCVFRCDH